MTTRPYPDYDQPELAVAVGRHTFYTATINGSMAVVSSGVRRHVSATLEAEQAVDILLRAYVELTERNRRGWTLANAAIESQQTIFQAMEDVFAREDLPRGCYHDEDGRERILHDGRLNNCAVANGQPMADCQMCHGVCPGKDER